MSEYNRERKKIIGIFGSRELQGQMVYEYIKGVLKKYSVVDKDINTIKEGGRVYDYFCIPGGIKGACDLAKKVCEELRLDYKTKYYISDKGSFYAINTIRARTKEIIKEADEFIVFHDGKSRGTLWDIEHIKKAKKKYEYHLINFDKDSIPSGKGDQQKGMMKRKKAETIVKEKDDEMEKIKKFSKMIKDDYNDWEVR